MQSHRRTEKGSRSVGQERSTRHSFEILQLWEQTRERRAGEEEEREKYYRVARGKAMEETRKHSFQLVSIDCQLHTAFNLQNRKCRSSNCLYLWARLWGIVLITNWCRRTQSILGEWRCRSLGRWSGAVHEKIKQTEGAFCRVSVCFRLLHEFRFWLPSTLGHNLEV